MNWFYYCKYIPFWNRCDPSIRINTEESTYAMDWIMNNSYVPEGFS